MDAAKVGAKGHVIVETVLFIRIKILVSSRGGAVVIFLFGLLTVIIQAVYIPFFFFVRIRKLGLGCIFLRLTLVLYVAIHLLGTSSYRR
jgi:hypothetical protein